MLECFIPPLFYYEFTLFIGINKYINKTHKYSTKKQGNY